MNVIRFFDPIVLRLFSGACDENDEEQFHLAREAGRRASNKSLVDSVLHDMAHIDTKSTALLTHISVIIAALVFSLGEVNSGVVRVMIAFEIIAYVLVALLNLRCLNIMGPPHMLNFSDGLGYQAAIVRDVFLRRCVYVFCLRAVFLLTAILPFMIALEMSSDLLK